MTKPFGVIGSLLFAAVLFVTCLGASFECVLALSYSIVQGFGWEWGENKKPVEAARFNLVIVVFLLIAFIISIADIIDSQLETRDKKNIGRVADIEAVRGEDGTHNPHRSCYRPSGACWTCYEAVAHPFSTFAWGSL